MAPVALGVSVTESTVWPALAVLKATVTGPPCAFQLAPPSDTTWPLPPEAGLAVSVCAPTVPKVTVAVAEMVPATGVVLGWVTTTAPVAGAGVGTVIAPCSAGGTSVPVAMPVHSGLGTAGGTAATAVQYADGVVLRVLVAVTPPTVAVNPGTPAAAFGEPVMDAPHQNPVAAASLAVRLFPAKTLELGLSASVGFAGVP